MAATAATVQANAQALNRAKLRAKRQRRRRKMALIKNPRVQFADWLKRKHPDVFEAALSTAETATVRASDVAAAKAAGVTTGPQLGQWEGWTDPYAATKTATETKSFWQKFTEGALAAGTTYLTLKNQRDAMELNLERAKAGLAPIDPATTAPVIRTQVDIDPTLARDLASDVGAGINRNMMIFGGLALVLLFFMMRR